MITDTLLVFDNLKQKVKVISNVFLDGRQSLKEAYQEAQEKIRRIVAQTPKVRHSLLPRKNLSLHLLCAQISAEKIL